MSKYVEICSHPKTVVVVKDDVEVTPELIEKLRIKYRLQDRTQKKEVKEVLKSTGHGSVSRGGLDYVGTSFDPWK